MQIPTAPELYALSQHFRCDGPYECHWCMGRCGPDFHHGEPPPVPFLKGRSGAKRPANPWICKGCWLWNRQRITTTFLRGDWLDSQAPKKHSVWITEKEALTIRLKEDGEELVKLLLKPPLRFVLSLISEGENLLHLCPVNWHERVKAETPLLFNANNITHEYTIYELKEALKFGPEGKRPGVGVLMALLDLQPQPPEEEERKQGRPPALPSVNDTLKKIVTRKQTAP